MIRCSLLWLLWQKADSQFSTKAPIVEHDWDRDPGSLPTDSKQLGGRTSLCRKTAWARMPHPVAPGAWSATRKQIARHPRYSIARLRPRLASLPASHPTSALRVLGRLSSLTFRPTALEIPLTLSPLPPYPLPWGEGRGGGELGRGVTRGIFMVSRCPSADGHERLLKEKGNARVEAVVSRVRSSLNKSARGAGERM